MTKATHLNVNVLGSANANATVTVNLQRATRHGSYFQDELVETNTSATIFQSFTNLAVFNNVKVKGSDLTIDTKE
jgi:hypothetical protein